MFETTEDEENKGELLLTAEADPENLHRGANQIWGTFTRCAAVKFEHFDIALKLYMAISSLYWYAG